MLDSRIVLHALMYASLATITVHYSSVGRKRLAKMSFQMAGKPGRRCQELLIHRAVLAKKELRHSWMFACQERQGSCMDSHSPPAGVHHRLVLIQSDAGELKISRLSCVITLSAVFSPSHLYTSLITIPPHANLHFLAIDFITGKLF